MAGSFEVRILHDPKSHAVADIIFVHGLGGEATETWTHENKHFWPDTLAKDAPSLRVLSVNHPSEKLANVFVGGGMGIVDRSKATLELLETYDLGERPTIFITHSLGGLITKGLLRKAHDIGGDKYSKILATPHYGSSLATALAKIPAFPSKVTRDLAKGQDSLTDLRDWYVQRANERKIKTKAFFESEKLSGAIVVPRDSANPGTIDGEPVGVDKHHIDICKFEHEDVSTYRMIRKFIFDCLKELQIDPTSQGNPSDFDFYTTPVEDDRKSLEEKLDDGGRQDEVRMALREKERIAEHLYRNAISPTSKNEYKRFLGDIVSRFKLAVLPHINSGQSIAFVNERLQSAVIDQVKDRHYRFSSQDDIHAAIYYLTGNCHIWWSSQSGESTK